MKEFLLDPKFLIPLLSTIGASCTILIIQFINTFFKIRRQKMYAITYMTDVTVRLLQASCIIKGNTILPHIDAVKRILGGDSELLEKTLLMDDFDILTDSPMKFNHLPEEYKVLIGQDNLSLLQCFDAILYLYENESTRRAFNGFVKNNLKAMIAFKGKTEAEQEDIFNTYWDYLSSLEHEENRIIAMIIHLFLPDIEKYIDKKYFLFCDKNEIYSRIKHSEKLKEIYKQLIPSRDFFKQAVSGGIQNLV